METSDVYENMAAIMTAIAMILAWVQFRQGRKIEQFERDQNDISDAIINIAMQVGYRVEKELPGTEHKS
jgi:hypothetical protein